MAIVYCATGKRASHPSEPVAWKLISIAGDGSTTLQAYSNVGALVEKSDATVTGAELADQFVLFDKKFLLHDNYPSDEAHHTGSSKTDFIPDRVRECMQVLAKTMIDHRLDVRPQPSKAVFAKADLESDIAVGKLRLTPVSRSYTLFDGSKKGAVDHPRSQCTTVCPGGDKVITAICQPGIDDVCNAYWFIGVTDEKGKANMALVTEDVSFILASVGKLRITDHVHIAKVPLYTNIAIIKKGEELLSYMPKVEKTEDTGDKTAPVLAVRLSGGATACGGGKRQKT